MLVNLWGQLFIWHFHNSQQIHARRRLILVAASVWRQPAVHLTNYVDHWGASFQLFYFISVVVAICSIYNKQPAFFLNQLLIAAQLVRVKRFAAEKIGKFENAKVC